MTPGGRLAGLAGKKGSVKMDITKTQARRCYYSEKQRAMRKALKLPETNWYLTTDGREVEVTSVDAYPPQFDDVQMLGDAVKWLREGDAR